MKNTILTLAILLSLACPSYGQFSSEPEKDHTLLVKGTAIIREVPELIFASINIKSESKDYTECQDKLLTRMNVVRSSLKKHGIEGDLIKTEEINIRENVDYENGKSFHIGFKGSINFLIETKYTPEFARRLFSALKTDSLTLEYNIIFRLSEDQKTNIRKKAIELAVADAREKAQVLANSSAVRLVRINTISFNDDVNPFDTDRDIIRTINEPALMKYAVMEFSPDSEKSVDFNPKELGIIKTVAIEYTIANKAKR
jgi:uncharacterized protein